MASILKAGRHVAMWSAGAGAVIPLILPTVLAEDKPESVPCCQGKIKPSQLPIYDEPEDLYDITYHVSGKGQLQEGVEVVRKELEEALESTKELRDQVDHIYQTGKAHTAGQIAYLREEENLPARAGAIAAGGLVGLLLGTRGRIIKKLLYTSVGAGATGAVLYPEYCKLYSQDLWHNANTYATVAYNFFVGVKPQVNGSGSGSQETAATSVDSGKSKSLDARGVEVSNPYPSLLTFPYTTLFRKQESSLTLLPREKPTKVENSFDRIAEDASQVSMLGFRLLDSEKQVTGGALSGFGSVTQENSDKCNKCGKKKRAHKKKSEDHEVTKFDLTSLGIVDSTSLSVPVVENNIETFEKGIVDKIESVSKEVAEFIDELRTGTEFVAEVSDEVIAGAETVRKVLETVETVASFVPGVGTDVAATTKRAAGEVGVLVGVASKVKQAAEKTETVLATVEKVAEDVESLAEKVSDLDRELTSKETHVEASKKGTVDVIEAVAGEASKGVNVIKTGLELVAEISHEVEAISEAAEKFAETLEKSEGLPQVVGAKVATVANEAALVAGIAGEVNRAAGNAEKLLDSLAEVVEKVETLEEKVSSHKKPVPAAAVKNLVLQSEIIVESIADAQDEANSRDSIFDKLASFFSSKKATESVPSKFIDSSAFQQLKIDERSSEVASDSESITLTQGTTADTNKNVYLEAKIETPTDIHASKAPPIVENHGTLEGETLHDKRVDKLDVVQATKDEKILTAETMNTEGTKVEPEGATTLDIATASLEKTVDAEANSVATQVSDKLVDQSEIGTKSYILKDDANDQLNPLSEVEEFPEKKSLFSRLSDFFGSKEPERVQQYDRHVSPLPNSSEMAASDGLKPKADVIEPEADNNQSIIATPTLEFPLKKNSDASPLQSQSCVLQTPNSETTQVPVTEAQSATPPLETPASLPEIVEELATQIEPTITVTGASQETALPETVATQETVLLETLVTEEITLPKTVVTQETTQPETVANQESTLSEIDTVLKTAPTDDVSQETVTQAPAVQETATLDHTHSEIISQEPTSPQAIHITKEFEYPLVANKTHADQAAAATAVVPHRPGVTITQSEKDVIVSSEASSLVLPAEPDAADPAIVAPLVRQLDGYTIVETPGTMEDITYTLEDEAAADSEAPKTIKSAGASVSSKTGLYSYTNESSKINLPTSAETKLLAPSTNIVSQSTMSDDKNRDGDSTGKVAPQAPEQAKDVVVRAEADKNGGGETKHEVDHGQSNPEDADMYTTRS